MVHEPGKNPYPRSTDHFVVPPELEQFVGSKSRTLSIMLPSDDPEAVFPQVYKLYRSTGLYCAGDGLQARRWDERGNLKELPCPCPALEHGECGPVATLNFLLPECPGIGIWQITTGNKRSIVSLNTSLEMFSRMFGGLTGIPFTLRLEPEHLQRFDDRQRKMVRQTLHVLRLDSSRTLREIVEWRAKVGAPVAALMPAPEEEEADLVAGLSAPAEAENGGDEPSNAGVISAEPTISPSSPAPASDPAPMPWTIEACFAAARRAGIGAEEYECYLIHKHRCPLDDLSARALAQEGDAWAKAADSDLARETLRSVILTIAAKARKESP